MQKSISLSTLLTFAFLNIFSSGNTYASDSALTAEDGAIEKSFSSIVDAYAIENNLSEENKNAALIIAQDAIKNDYKVNWSIFDFSNTNHDIQATAVAQTLDVFLSNIISQLTKSVAYAQGDNEKIKQIYAQRTDLSAKQTYVMNSWSAAFLNDPSLLR